MRCKKCGCENSDIKRTCEHCGAFLEGWTFNNVTGKYGYRTDKGEFLSPEKAKEIIKYQTVAEIQCAPEKGEIDELIDSLKRLAKKCKKEDKRICLYSTSESIRVMMHEDTKDNSTT